MTSTDAHMARLDASNTASCFHYAHSLTLAMALAASIPQVTNADVHIEADNIQIRQQQSTNQAYSINRGTADTDIFLAINDIFETLTAQQKELDVEARQIMEDNRWDLYL